MKDTNYLIFNGVDLSQAIELLGDLETFDNNLPNFANGLKEKMSNLKDYLVNGDLENYSMIAHSLKSDTKFFGFNKLSNIALDHETKSKEKDIEYLKTHFKELFNEALLAFSVCNTYLGNTPTTSKKENNNAKFDKTILIADDSDVVIGLAKDLLKDTYNIITAANGDEVISLIKSGEKFDAILLDLNMPKVDGYAVLNYMNENDLFDEYPVSIISGNSDKNSIDKAFTYPIVDMLTKPFNENTIKGIVEKTINRKY